MWAKDSIFPEWIRTDRAFMIAAAVVVVVLYVLFLNVPVFGDAYGYGYSTAEWFVENGLQPVPAGEGRGEQAMGHPALFFWVWALLMRVLGDSIAVIRILPSVATFLALTGTYRLGKQLAGSLVGVCASAALLASPLFITQAFRPLPDSAMVAAVSWSLYFFASKKMFKAAICCVIATIFREQAIFLASGYIIAEVMHSGLRKPGRLLLFASPVLVIVITGLLNLAVNGYFFFPNYLGSSSVLEANWLTNRLRFFACHLLAEDFRWLPVTAALAVMLADRSGERFPVPSILIILFPAIFCPPARLLFILMVIAALVWYIVRQKRLPGRTFLVFLIFPAILVMFHVLIVMAAPDPCLNLFRYVIGAYPVILAGSLAMIWKKASRKLAASLTIIFIVSTFSANRSTHYPFQPDTSLACLKPIYSIREAFRFASDIGDTVIVSETNLNLLQKPALGYISSPVPSRTLTGNSTPMSGTSSYTVVLSSFDETMSFLDIVAKYIPDESVLQENPIRAWTDGCFITECYRIIPACRETAD